MTNPLEVFAGTIHLPTWMIFQAALPLAMLALLVFYLCVVEHCKDGYAHVLGKGVVFMFSTLLLLGVMRMIEQAENFAREYGYKIGLRTWRAIVLGLSFIFLSLYGMNAYTVLSCELVQKVSELELLDKLRMWSKYGLVGAGTAIFFAVIAVSQTIKALLKYSD
jgi:hypothetical protein